MPENLTRRNFLQRLKGASVIAPATVGLTASELWVPKTKTLSPGLFHFETHGSSVAVEHPDRVNRIQRGGPGTFVYQNANSWNWFTFVIPTPEALENEVVVDVLKATLSVRVDVNTLITQVQVWHGAHLLLDVPNLQIIGQDWFQVYFLPEETNVFNGLAISVRADWIRDNGELLLISAGASFIDR